MNTDQKIDNLTSTVTGLSNTVGDLTKTVGDLSHTVTDLSDAIISLSATVTIGFKSLRAELKGDIEDLARMTAAGFTEVHSDISEIKQTMATKNDIAVLRDDIDNLAHRVKDIELAHS
jgi:archaellum component FlaC